MNTCDTCKWWDPERYCNNPLLNDVGITQHGYVDEVPKKARADAFFRDDAVFYESDWYVLMMPGPKFGCIHHNPK